MTDKINSDYLKKPLLNALSVSNKISTIKGIKNFYFSLINEAVDKRLRLLIIHIANLLETFDGVTDGDEREKIIKNCLKSIDEYEKGFFKKTINKEYFFDRDFFNYYFDYLEDISNNFIKYKKKYGLYTNKDLLNFLPKKYVDRRNFLPILNAPINSEVVVSGKIVKKGVVFLKGRRRIYEAIIQDKTGMLKLTWFNFNKSYPESVLQENKVLFFFGKITHDRYTNLKNIIHPDIITNLSNLTAGIYPVYPSERYFSGKRISELVANKLRELKGEDYIGYEYISKIGIPSLKESFNNLHFPVNQEKIEKLNNGESIYHERLKFAQFLPFQLALFYRNNLEKRKNGIKLVFNEKYKEKLLKQLPFTFTKSQQRVIMEIENDQQSSYPMNRLLQGDVGSGKTLVAVVAALNSIEAGYQVSILAPTEILAEQHFKNISEYIKDLPISVAILLGSTPAKDKKDILEKIKNGDVNIVVGTHAIFQKKVNFNKLGLAVIDEQHRFGVEQRLRLVEKGENPDILVMSATPIPRTLAMTSYGDLDVSIIDELPKGRQEIQTKILRDSNRDFLYRVINDELNKNNQIYFVYPLIEKSEKIDLKNATDMYEKLSKVFLNYSVSLLHGKMSKDEKEEIMGDFKKGKIKILVSTTVIEVGVDVPKATVMVIEQAERFGLAQLHQLRGRVGRSERKSYCYLVAGDNVSKDGWKRLKVIEETNNGFVIAEEDLRIRGQGEILGTNQSGEQEIPYIDFIKYNDMLIKSRKIAKEILKEDSLLQYNKNRMLKEEMFKLWGEKMKLGKIG